MKNVKEKKMEMDILPIIFLMCLLLFILSMIRLLKNPVVSDTPNEYYRSAVVTDIKGNVAYLEDTTGNIWTVENENAQLYVRYILIMNDNNTDTIYDDVIVRIE